MRPWQLMLPFPEGLVDRDAVAAGSSDDADNSAFSRLEDLGHQLRMEAEVVRDLEFEEIGDAIEGATPPPPQPHSYMHLVSFG
jgi:hypothetical protein